MLLITYLAEVWGQLTLTAAIGQVWMLPFLVYLEVANTQKAHKWVVWAVISLLLSYPNGSSPAAQMTSSTDKPASSTSNPSSLELEERKHRPLAHRLGRLLQHVCAGRRHHFLKHLPCRSVLSPTSQLIPSDHDKLTQVQTMRHATSEATNSCSLSAS
jgi:hypothetical protein